MFPKVQKFWKIFLKFQIEINDDDLGFCFLAETKKNQFQYF